MTPDATLVVAAFVYMGVYTIGFFFLARWIAIRVLGELASKIRWSNAPRSFRMLDLLYLAVHLQVVAACYALTGAPLEFGGAIFIAVAVVVAAISWYASLWALAAAEVTPWPQRTVFALVMAPVFCLSIGGAYWVGLLLSAALISALLPPFALASMIGVFIGAMAGVFVLGVCWALLHFFAKWIVESTAPNDAM